MNTYELKPCPFCGGHPQITYGKSPGCRKNYLELNSFGQVICDKCGNMTGYFKVKTAIRKWNARIGEPQV